MLKVKQDKNSITLTIPTNLKNARQRHTLNGMIESNDVSKVVAYLSSFNGKQARLNIERFESHGTDKLARKDVGSIYERFERMLRTNVNHTPIDSKTDYFGVEIECCIPRAAVNDTTRECDSCGGSGVQYDDDENETECNDCDGSGRIGRSGNLTSGLAEMFREEKIKLSSIKNDSSIEVPDDSYFAIEITVLTRLSDSSNLERACKLLNRIGAKVNKSCGLHIHIDARHLTSDQVKASGRRFARALPVLLSMVPQSRRDNHFCRPSVSTLKGSRYHAVNLTAFSKYKTIEVRLHSSTTDFSKIMLWTRLLLAIHTSNLSKNCATINELCEYVSIDENLVEYISQRTALFNPTSLAEARAADASSYRDADSSDSQTLVQVGV